MLVNGVKVTTDLSDLSVQEAARYVEETRKRIPADDVLDEIYVSASGDGVDVSYRAHGAPFERIRRITGYRATRLHMKSMHA